MNDVQTKALLDFLELKAVTNEELEKFAALEAALGYEKMTVEEEVAEEAEVAQEAEKQKQGTKK